MAAAPHYIEHPCLSVAWAEACLALGVPGCDELPCLTISFTGFNNGVPFEDSRIRQLLEDELITAQKQNCETVANTIFPRGLWNPEKPAEELWQRYFAILPRLRKKHSANRNGLYFERMTAYGPENKNQLEYIINTWRRGNHRRTALQILVFYPARDDTHQRQRGFPCLSQVSLSPNGDRGLAVTGYYPMQYIFERAYGNYLGLARLGQFLAHEMDLDLVRVSCMATVARRDFKPTIQKDLLEDLRTAVVAARGQGFHG